MKNKNSSIIIFGATGDLTKRKLIPSLYRLYNRNIIDNSYPIICVGRKELSKDNFLEALELSKFMPKINSDKLKDQFLKNIHYLTLNFSDDSCKKDCEDCQSCKSFKEDLLQIENSYNTTGNRIFYMATPSSIFLNINRIIEKAGLTKDNGIKRLAFEKPFGHDLDSATSLNKIIEQSFNEDQIFRIDHYLGKALIQDILVFRFSNALYENLWNSKFIDHIQITVSESVGVEKRGNYYDKSGAIRDMLQNHLLQILALTTMDKPKSLDVSDIREEKIKVLKSIKDIKEENIVVAQYDDYKKESNINQNSNTETFVALKVELDHPSWQQVPIYLRTGKKQGNTFAEINIILKEVKDNIFSCSLEKRMCNNYITIRIQPDTGIAQTFNTQTPETNMELTPVTMDFCHRCLFAINTPEAYESLFESIINGNRTHFPSWNEIEASWSFIDKIKNITKNKLVEIYPNDSPEVEGANKLIENDQRVWIRK